MPHPIELTVILKDNERIYRQKFLEYSAIVLDPENLIIKECINQARTNFVGVPEEICIKVSMEM